MSGQNSETIQKIDENFLKITLDQLTTFLVMAEKRSEYRAASALDREPASIRRQMDALIDHIKALGGGPLLIRPGTKGTEITLTHAGRALQAHAEQILLQVAEAARALTSPRLIHVGLTSYMSRHAFTREILQEASNRFEKDNLAVRLVLSNIGSDDIETKLKNHMVDFVFGGLVLEPDGSHELDPGIVFLEFLTEEFGLVCNYNLPPNTKRITATLLQKHQDRFIVPTHGVYRKALERLLSLAEVKELIAVQSSDARLSLDLLTSVRQESCILSSDVAVDLLMKSDPQLHFWRLDPPVRGSIGFFARNQNYQDTVYETFKAVAQSSHQRYVRKRRKH